MSLNSYVTLGRSGLRVSPFCLGAMTFGEDYGVGFGSNEKVQIARSANRDALASRGGGSRGL